MQDEKEIEKKIAEPIGVPGRADFRKGVMELQEAILKIPGTTIGDQADMPLHHSFGEGIYVREIFMPAGKLVISKIHKKAHPYFVLKGVLSVLTEEGPKLIRAPYYGMTPAGTKRVLYIHEDTVWITVHATDETDIEKIEEEIIAKNFDECLPNLVKEVPAIEESKV